MVKQAVILAGGRGTRLKPLTDTVPKPMITFFNKPFLEYLIENLKANGIEKVLILLGYLPEKVEQYFKDGSRFGVEIGYSVTDVGNETGRRMKLAEKMFDDEFLFMYCDNYWPLCLPDMAAAFKQRNVLGQLTVYSNKDNYTRPNIKLDEQGIITQYDKTRQAPGLRVVDIGYALFKKEIMALMPSGNLSFEETVYPKLVAQKQLAAYVTDHRYYSVSSHERLPLTKAFLKREPTIILDRDGVLNVRQPKSDYVKKWPEFRWLPGAREAVALLKKAGYRLILVTNQAGIARGLMTEADLADIHQKMKADLEKSGGALDAIYYCPHGWNDNCDCRKPKPGMLFFAQRDFNLDLSRTIFIGDDVRDEQAGRAAGCPTLLVSDQLPLLKLVKEKILKQ